MELESIGRNIRKFRLMRNLRQEDLAEMAGLSINYVGALERGEKIPSLETFIVAVVSHQSQIRKGAIRPEHIYKLLKFVFEFPRVELVAVVGPPSVVELFSGSSEVHPYMAYRSQHRILGLVHLGIEKARLLNGSGPKRKGIFYCRLCLPHHLVHLHYFMNTINTTTIAESLSEKT